MPLQFDRASEFDKSYRDVLRNDEQETRHHVWRSYAAALDRVYNLGDSKITLVYYAGLFVYFKDRAQQRTMAEKIKPPLDGPLIWQYQQEMFENWKGGRTDEQINEQVRLEGAHNLGSLIRSSGESLRQGIDATLSAMLSDAWSAYENCVGGLWIDAVNRCPAVLGDRLIENKSVQLDRIASFGYDLRHRLGSFLVDTKRFQFTSLKEAQAAYRAAFTFGAAGIQDPFQPYGALDAVSGIRNCFAHKSGIVDARSVNSIRGMPAFADIEIGQRINLDGNSVCACIDATVESARLTYGALERWFEHHGDECERQIRRRAQSEPPGA